MFILTHIIAGLLVGKLTGNYTFALLGSVLIDMDHLFSYIKHGVLFSPRKFWRTITSREDLWGDQRGILHNFLAFILISAVLFLLGFFALIAFCFGYLSQDIFL